MSGKTIELSPLKIKYFREFMEEFDRVKTAENDDQAIEMLLECARISMQQFYPEISESLEEVEDELDLPTLYKIIEVGGGIKINGESEQEISEQASQQEDKGSWEDLDLAKLELEAFMIGNWKNFEELETSLCLTELIEILSTQRELSYEERKFAAAVQGIDLEKDSNKGQKEWEDLKARVYSKGKATDSKDIMALQGQNAANLGFGIGMGLDYKDLTKKS